LESGIQVWNPEPKELNPESKELNPESKERNLESKEWNPESKECMDYLTWTRSEIRNRRSAWITLHRTIEHALSKYSTIHSSFE
jgi:hypothetical protein